MLSRLPTSFLKINPPGLVLGGFFCYHGYMTPEQIIEQILKNTLETASADGWFFDFLVYQKSEGELAIITVAEDGTELKTYRANITLEEIA